jgi:hypothetical protein
MNKNLEKVDQIEKTEIKQLDTYIDQVTTDKLSLVSRLRTSDEINGFTSSFLVLFTFPTNICICFAHKVGDSYLM